MSGQVTVKVFTISEAYELGGIVPGAYVDQVAFGQADGLLPIHTQHGIPAAQRDADGGAFREHDCPIHG